MAKEPEEHCHIHHILLKDGLCEICVLLGEDSPPPVLSDADLKKARDWGLATFLSSYVRIMTRVLAIDESDTEMLNAMAVTMVNPINPAMDAIWKAMMKDKKGRDEALEAFRQALEEL